MSSPPRGRLLLVPNGLDLGTDTEVDLTEVLPQAVLQASAQIEHWVVENAKTARAFLKRVDRLVPLTRSLQSLDIRELPRPRKGAPNAEAPDLAPLLAPALAGHDVGLLSEAGLPAVAAPGAALVQAAHRLGLTVWPMSGPSSLMLALAGSGLNGQSFAFVGYLEQASRRMRQTQIAIETPYRNAALVAALLEHLAPATQLCIASGLTLPQGQCRSMPVAQWRAHPPVIGDKLPAVFLWLAD